MGLALQKLQVSLKFYGGGNFNIILALQKLQVSLKFYGGGNFNIILAFVEDPKSVWSSMGVGLLISF